MIGLELLSAVAWASRVAVIRDDDASLYSKATLGVSVELLEGFSEYSLLGHASRGAEVVKSAMANGAKLLITIGPKSTNAAKNHAPHVPAIYCLTPRIEDYDLKRPNAVGIRLEVPLARQLGLLKVVDPKIRRIAIVADPGSSQALVDRYKTEAKELGLEIIVAQAKLPTAVAGALADLPRIDALLLAPDPVALRMTSFDAMRDFAMRKKIPFLGLDDGFVARGALLSFAIDYGLTGRQAGALANRILNDGFSLKEIAIVEHEALNLAINVSVSDQVFEDGSFSRRLLQIAAQNRYGIEVF